MGNPISMNVETGTIGELLVQLRLLEYGVQAAPPVKDSGNDLIALKGRIVKLVQIKTSLHGIPPASNLPLIWDIVFLVDLKRNSTGKFLLDESKIYALENGKSGKGELNQELVNKIWKKRKINNI